MVDAYQWDTTRHILVSDRSRKAPGTDDVRWELRRVSRGDADYLAITPELQPNRAEV